MRDFVLGVRIIDGTGEALAFGGRVMKNVAGFDVSRLMTGALGTLGVLTEVSLKCLPLPKAEATRVFDCSGATMRSGWSTNGAASRCRFRRRAFTTGRLCGAPVRRAARGRERVARSSAARKPTATRSGAALRDQTLDSSRRRCAGDATLWRLSVRSTAPYTDLGGEQLIEWGGALRWLIAQRRVRRGREVRAWASAHGGHATLFRGPDKSAGAFQPLSAPVFALHQRLKAVFDPHGILNRGRLYRGVLMETRPRSPSILDTPEGREADAILRACVHCGFCTATCPTYQLLGDELDGPRGRIYLIKQVLEGGEVTAKTQLHLDRCLTCRSCETTCPSGVRYGRLVDIGRKFVDDRVGRAPVDAAKRAALRRGLLSKSLFGAALAVGRLAKPFLPRALASSIPEARQRGHLAGAAACATRADRAGLRAAVTRAEHRRGHRARARPASAFQRFASKAAAAAARCRITCPSMTRRARSRAATSMPGGRTSSAAPRRSSSRRADAASW